MKPHQLAENTNYCIDMKKRFGVVGKPTLTGLTDYSAQIQLAMDSVISEKLSGTLLFPPGYIYASQLKYRTGITIRGTTVGVLAVSSGIYTDANAPLFMLDPLDAFISGFTIENIVLRGSSTGANQHLIHVRFDPASTLQKSMNRLKLNHVQLVSAGGSNAYLEGLSPGETGINSGYIQQFRMDHCYVTNSVGSNLKIVGVVLESGIKGTAVVKGGDDTIPNIFLSSDAAIVSAPNVGPYRFNIEGCFINNPDDVASGTHVSIYAKDTQQLHITDVDFEHFNIAVQLDGTSSRNTTIECSKLVPVANAVPATIDVIACNGLSIDNNQFGQAGTSAVAAYIRYSGSNANIKNVDITPSNVFQPIAGIKVTSDKNQLVDASGRVVFYRTDLVADTAGAAATDNLDIITDTIATTSVTGFYDGQEVIIHPFFAGREIIVRDASVSGGNIQTRGTVSARLSLRRHNIRLRFNEATLMFIEVERSDATRPSTRLADTLLAALPSAVTYPGYEVFVTDLGINGGSLLRSNGTNWRSAFGSIVLSKLITPITSVADATEQRTITTMIPASLFLAGMTLELTVGGTKSAAVQTINLSSRMGSANSNTDAALTDDLALAGASVQFGVHFKYSWASDTTVRTEGNSGASGAAVNSFAQVNGAAAARISTMALGMAANPMYFSFTTQNITASPTETATINYYKLELVG